MRIDLINASREAWLEKWFGWLLGAAFLVNAGALWITIMEPDGALYASIAKTIARTGDFIDLRAEGRDWLDKPHFPFWMAALSFRLFGFSSFAYKFPALLFWAAGGYYTWRFALSGYSKPVAQLAVLIYVSAAHLVISNNDVRAEPYLTGLVIGSVYHFYRVFRAGRVFDLVAGSLLAACAVMTKGPFVLVTIGSGFVIDWALSKDWRQFLRLRWWIALALIFLFILPELYCLYAQFDLHPEKIVFGRTGVSGIRWFFWDSQFGRFFNTGPIRGSGDPLFYFHTLLWAFMPWSLLLYATVFARCRNWKRYGPGGSILLGATLVSFVMFSLSRFQLPHYLNILFPFFAILTADWLYGLHRKKAVGIVVIVQNGLALLFAVLLIGLCWKSHFPGYAIVLCVLVPASIMALWMFRKKSGGGDEALMNAVGRSMWMALVSYAFINFFLYPGLLNYQAGSQAAGYLEKEGTGETVYMLREAYLDYSFEFYYPAAQRWININSLPAEWRRDERSNLLFVPEAFEDSLIGRGWAVREIRRFPNFHISQLTGEFLDYRTRAATLKEFLLIRVSNGVLAK
jgi:4-amino-4-deoxy-L-arabinose transferase-like glycosyltransferase